MIKISNFISTHMNKKNRPFILFTTISLVLVAITAVGAVMSYTQVRQEIRPRPANLQTFHGNSPDRPDFSQALPYTSATKGSLQVGAKLGSQTISTKDGKAYMLITLQGDKPEIAPENERPPLNLAIVIDRSGSMNGQKLTYVKDALSSITSMLGPEDRISLIIYDDHVSTIYQSRNFDQSKFLREIEGITSGGSTNLEGGLRQGISNVNEFMSDNSINKVILLSDGLANVGISDADQLAAIVDDLVSNDIVVSTIGVGTDYDEDLMASVAIAGNGNYYYLENPVDAERIFSDELQNTISTVAKDISVEFNLQDKFKIVRGIGYELESNDNFTPNNIYSGRTVTYLFEIEENRLNSSATNMLVADLKITFTDVETGQKETIEIPIYAEIVSKEVEPLHDDEVYYEFIVGQLGQQLWQVYENLDKRENDLARKNIDSTIELLEEANIRMDGVFDEDLLSLNEKQQYLEDLEDSYVNDSGFGRSFQKSNQSESYETVYNK